MDQTKLLLLACDQPLACADPEVCLDFDTAGLPFRSHVRRAGKSKYRSLPLRALFVLT